MTCREAMAECGLFVRRDGRVARPRAAALLAALNRKIDSLIRCVEAYEAKIAEQRGEIIRLKAELEEERRGG
ncbi:MAG: hypothetical protein LBG43_00295 [Treponema sp.]|jgi:hypothetical protein|nr:hypothetical protein [Treponema sp.]